MNDLWNVDINEKMKTIEYYWFRMENTLIFFTASSCSTFFILSVQFLPVSQWTRPPSFFPRLSSYGFHNVKLKSIACIKHSRYRCTDYHHCSSVVDSILVEWRYGMNNHSCGCPAGCQFCLSANDKATIDHQTNPLSKYKLTKKKQKQRAMSGSTYIFFDHFYKYFTNILLHKIWTAN